MWVEWRAHASEFLWGENSEEKGIKILKKRIKQRAWDVAPNGCMWTNRKKESEPTQNDLVQADHIHVIFANV